MPDQLEMIGRIALALLLGGIVGLERELTDQDAGLRTHISVALGSCLFALVSAYGFEEFDQRSSGTTYQVDVTRIASQIVTGVGFLGGGAILKHGASVRGLTTAASLWITAAIGLAVAVGSYWIATATTLALLASLVGLRAPKRWLDAHLVVRRRTITVRLASSRAIGAVVDAIEDLDAEVRSTKIRGTDEGPVITADIRLERGADVHELMAAIGERDDVTSVDID